MLRSIALAACLLALPGLSAAQEGTDGWIQVDLRAGFDAHGAGGCSVSGSGVSFGAALDAGRAWFVRSSVDLLDVFRTGSDICDASLPAILLTRPLLDRGAPRLAAMLGRKLHTSGVQYEVSVGVGAIRTRMDAIDVEWRPWIGGSVVLRSSLGPRLEIEYGRHQLTRRRIRSSDSELLSQFRTWHDMWRFSVAMPLVPLVR